MCPEHLASHPSFVIGNLDDAGAGEWLVLQEKLNFFPVAACEDNCRAIASGEWARRNHLVGPHLPAHVCQVGRGKFPLSSRIRTRRKQHECAVLTLHTGRACWTLREQKRTEQNKRESHIEMIAEWRIGRAGPISHADDCLSPI